MSDDREPVRSEDAGGPPWRVGLIAGGAIFAFGLYGLLRNARATLPGDWLAWVAGAVLLHDLILAPLVLAAGFLLTRLVPAVARAGVQATLVVCGAVALMSVPVVMAAGRQADNPSLLPHDYGRNLAIVVALVFMAGMVMTLARVVRSRS